MIDVSSPWAIVAMVVSACSSIVGTIWWAFSTGKVVAGSVHQRECQRADKAESAMWRLLGVTEIVVGGADVMLTRRERGEQGADDVTTR